MMIIWQTVPFIGTFPRRHVLVGATSFGVSTCEGPYPAMFTRWMFFHPHGHYGNSGSLPTFLSSTLPWFPPPWSTWWSTRHPPTLPPSLPSAPPLSLTYSDALCVEKYSLCEFFVLVIKKMLFHWKQELLLLYGLFWYRFKFSTPYGGTRCQILEINSKVCGCNFASNLVFINSPFIWI